MHYIDSSYNCRKPMIITTNPIMNEQEYPDSREKMRIYDRILTCSTLRGIDEAHIRSSKREVNRILAHNCLHELHVRDFSM